MLAIATTLLGGIVARAVVPTFSGRGSHTVRNSEEQDTVKRVPELVVADSMRSLYKYTDALKRRYIYSDTAGAQALLNEAVEIDSLYAPALYELTRDGVEQPQIDEQTIENARKAYLSDTTNRWYAAIYAQSLVIAGRHDEAIPLYQRLMKIDRQNPDYYRILALIYQQRQQPFSALAILDSADMRFGKIAYLANMKRHILLSTGQIDRAIDEAKQIVDAAPYEQSNVLSLGETYAAAGRDSLARITLEQALRMDSTNIDALTIYADFCSSKRDMHTYLKTLRTLYAQEGFPLERKIELFNRLTQDRKFYSEHFYALGAMASTLIMYNPDHKGVIDLYANHLIAGGQLDLALDLFKRHLKDEPPVMDYYMAVVDIEEYLGRTDSMDYYLARSMERFPNDAVFQIRKANRQYIKGDLHGAIATFDEALGFAQNDTVRGELWGYIGDAYHAIADRARLKKLKADTVKAYPVRLSEKAAMKRCYEAYDNALALWSDNVLVLNNYAYFLSVQNTDLERALEMSKRATTLEQNNSTYIDTYAWILYMMGRLDEARTQMRQALSLDRSGSAELPLHYGDILYAMGEKFMAETYWRRALEAGADPKRIEQRMAISKSGTKGRVEELGAE